MSLKDGRGKACTSNRGACVLRADLNPPDKDNATRAYPSRKAKLVIMHKGGGPQPTPQGIGVLDLGPRVAVGSGWRWRKCSVSFLL
jgi:hypothetical protein